MNRSFGGKRRHSPRSRNYREGRPRDDQESSHNAGESWLFYSGYSRPTATVPGDWPPCLWAFSQYQWLPTVSGSDAVTDHSASPMNFFAFPLRGDHYNLTGPMGGSFFTDHNLDVLIQSREKTHQPLHREACQPVIAKGRDFRLIQSQPPRRFRLRPSSPPDDLVDGISHTKFRLPFVAAWEPHPAHNVPPTS